MDQQKIGGFIASNRKSRGMTQVELAEQLGVTNKAVSKWERGKCLPDAELFQPLCKLLGITVNELLSGEAVPVEQAAEKAEATIVSLASDRQKADRWKRGIKCAAFAAAGINLAAGLFGFMLPWLGIYRTMLRPNMVTLLMTISHMALWGIAMETDREDQLLQWVTMILCIVLPISARLGLYSLSAVGHTYSYRQVLLTGMPCVLLLSGLLPWTGGFRPMFYFSIALSALGLAVSIRNLTAIHKTKRHEMSASNMIDQNSKGK